MSDEGIDQTNPAQSKSGSGVFVSILVAVILAYVLSPGPLVWLDGAGLLHPSIKGSVRVVYWPLRVGYENVPSVKGFYDWYFRLFGAKP